MSAPVTPGRRSAFSTRLTRGARAATASTARLTTAMASSQSPSMVVNMASVRFGSPLSRTTRTASATSSATPSPTPSGVTENATSTAFSSHNHLSERNVVRALEAVLERPAAVPG